MGKRASVWGPLLYIAIHDKIFVYTPRGERSYKRYVLVYTPFSHTHAYMDTNARGIINVIHTYAGGTTNLIRTYTGRGTANRKYPPQKNKGNV